MHNSGNLQTGQDEVNGFSQADVRQLWQILQSYDILPAFEEKANHQQFIISKDSGKEWRKCPCPSLIPKKWKL
jgi:hypothetical protein